MPTISTTLWTEEDSERRAGVPQLPIAIAMAGACMEVAHHLIEPQLCNSASVWSTSNLGSPPHSSWGDTAQDSCCEMPHTPGEPDPCPQPLGLCIKRGDLCAMSPVSTLNTAGGVVAVGPSQPHSAMPSGYAGAGGLSTLNCVWKRAANGDLGNSWCEDGVLS